MEKTVVLLNSDYSFLNVTTWKRAFALSEKGTASVVKYSKEVIIRRASEFSLKKFERNWLDIVKEINKQQQASVGCTMMCNT